MRITLSDDTALVSTSRTEAKRLGLALRESYLSCDREDLRKRTGLAPGLVAQLYDVLIDIRTPRVQVATPLFGVEQIVTPNTASTGQADLELVMDGDTVTMRLTRAGIRALGEAARIAAQEMSRPRYFLHSGVARADVLGLADVMTTEAASVDVNVLLTVPVPEAEAPPYPRQPPPPGTIRPSGRFVRNGPYLTVFDRERGEWVPEGGLRGGWVIPTNAMRPRPANMRIFELDMVAQPDLGMTPEPDALYRVSLSGGVEVDYFTDPTGRVCYIETIPGTASVPNPVLDGSQASTTYVVHPADGRYAVVLRTDEQARLVEVVADPLPSVGAYGQDEHPFVALSGAWPGGVSPRALLMSLGGPAAQGLAALGMRLAEAVNHGQHVAAHVQVLYADTGTVPSRLQVDYATDGQTATESFSNV